MKRFPAVVLLWGSLAMAQAPLHSAPQTQMAPITITKDNEKAEYPVWRAERIYFETTAAVALALNPQHPADLRPAIELEIGAKDNFVDEHTKDGKRAVAHISLQHWDDEDFSYAVAIVARDEALSNDDLKSIAHHVYVIVNATVDAH